MKETLLPRSLSEALRLLHGDPRLIPMAGGTDLMVKPDLRAREDTRFLFLCNARELSGVYEDGGQLIIGACTPLSVVRQNDAVRQRLPLLCEAVSRMASPQIRNRGTIGGNIMNASPAGDALAACIALNAVAKLVRFDGAGETVRRIPVQALVTAPGKTHRHPDELLAAVEITPPVGKWVYEKVSGRNSMAVGIVTLAIQCGGGPHPAIAVGACGPRVVRSPEAERMLHPGCAAAIVSEAVRVLLDALSPQDDIRADTAYRLCAAEKLLRYHIADILEVTDHADTF